MLKRTRFLLMISLLALVLGACASPESPATEAPATVEAGTTDETTTEMEQPDLAAAAEQLGVTEEALREALGDPSQGPPDFAAAAQALGVTEADLMAALGIAEGGMPPRDWPPTNTP